MALEQDLLLPQRNLLPCCNLETIVFSLMQDQYSEVLIYEILTIFLLNMKN